MDVATWIINYIHFPEGFHVIRGRRISEGFILTENTQSASGWECLSPFPDILLLLIQTETQPKRVQTEMGPIVFPNFPNGFSGSKTAE